MQRKTVVRRCQTVNVQPAKGDRLTRRFSLRAQDGLSDDGHRLTDGLSDGRGLREGGGAFLPLPPRPRAQARARVAGTQNLAVRRVARLAYMRQQRASGCLRVLSSTGLESTSDAEPRANARFAGCGAVVPPPFRQSRAA